MRISCKLFALASACSLLFAASARSQMVSPSIDRPGEPFSYFSHPTDEIGMMDAEAATEITPEGYLRTGFGELMFFAGPELEPTSVRIRTLEQGKLPIVHYQFERDGLVYYFSMFTATQSIQNGEPVGPSVNFIRVTIKNETTQPTRAILATGIRYDAPNNTGAAHGDNRFDRPREAKAPGKYRQLGEQFSPDWVYSFSDSGFLRDGRLLYTFPAGSSARSFTLHGFYNYPQDIGKPSKLAAGPTVPVGIVTFSQILAPGSERVLDFKMPAVPTSDAAEMEALAKARFDAAKASIVDFWNGMLAQGMQVTLPEHKVTDTFCANLIYDLIARDHIGDDYIQTVNKLHYHEFFLRDGADIVHSYDVTGYPEIARQDLQFFAKSQLPDGNFLSQSQQYDGWGEAVWAYAQHYRLTRDRDFAEWAIPQIDRAVAWLKQARAADPLHIMPASDVRDNEMVPGHLTGYNFLALSGLRLAFEMARETGHLDIALAWETEYHDYRAAFLKVLDAQAAANNGYIPPALDRQKGGFDWGNLLAVVPERTLDAHDPRVTATLKATQAKYAEGIMTYADGEFLHHYLTIKNTMTEVIRGGPEDQAQALRELYALLVHTSSTHAGFEFAILPWGDRNFQDNLAPHGWFAAEYRTLLRTMLVREEGVPLRGRLHLLSLISPAWIGRGKEIALSNAPTWWGKIAFRLTQPTESEALLTLTPEFTGPYPTQIVIHLPFFMDVKSATVDGQPASRAGDTLVVASSAKEIHIHLHWTPRPDAPHMSYDRAVADYKAEYARRYQELMHGPAH
jgi:hypothetical protein